MHKDLLLTVLSKVVYRPHPEVGFKSLQIDPKAIDGDEANICISGGCLIDITGNVSIGEWCMIGAGTQIWTHDHYHKGRKPLLLLQKELGVKVQDKIIGKDVWLHSCIVLSQVTVIPDGVVVGAGSVLTKIPGEYEVWAGSPAVKIGER